MNKEAARILRDLADMIENDEHYYSRSVDYTYGEAEDEERGNGIKILQLEVEMKKIRKFTGR